MRLRHPRQHQRQSPPGSTATIAALVVGSALVLSACADGDSDDPRPMTAAEAESEADMAPGQYTAHSTEIDGMERTWNLYVPDAAPDAGDRDRQPMPLVLVIHGTGDTGNGIRSGIGPDLESVADRDGFVIAYIDGYRNNWNECRVEGDWPAKQENVDDVGLMREVVTQIHGDLGPATVDPDRTFAIGFSSGGNMAQRLAFEASDVFSGIASVNANVPVDGNNACAGSDSGDPMPMIFVQGREDPVVPFDGGEVIAGTGFFAETRGGVLSAHDSAEWFAQRNASTSEPTTERDGDAEITTWPGDYPVTLVAVDYSGHSFPTESGRWGNDNGARYDAPGAILDFFSGLNPR